MKTFKIVCCFTSLLFLGYGLASLQGFIQPTEAFLQAAKMQDHPMLERIFTFILCLGGAYACAIVMIVMNDKSASLKSRFN